MLYKVITSSRSRVLSEGLTYEGSDGIELGTHVKVPLRTGFLEGIISEVVEKSEEDTFNIKSIAEIIGTAPLVHTAQMKTAQWMAHEYFCTLRQALGLFLPPLPWSKVFQKKDSSELRTQNSECKRPILNTEQAAAYESIRSETKPSLLFGVTGSGKTEIYLSLIAKALEQGKQAILLSPEIFLAEHLLPRIEQCIPRERIAVIHSKQTPAKARETWKRILRGDVSLVVGARSALFAPLKNIGLIILDEEHEWTYKSEQTPRYHAREVAETLARFSNAKLVLGSATPSVESWAKALADTYHLARLNTKFSGLQTPKVNVIDLVTSDFGKYYPFTNPLIEAIRDRLNKKEQSVLFLNHRGSASALLCLQCRRRVVSPVSQLPFTVHRARDGSSYLLDHSSGIKADVPSTCPHCQSHDLKEVGAGTERIESLLTSLFPSAKILRADSDTLTSLDDMKEVLSKMSNYEADILVGTQTVTKGLDLPNVTLAAVLIADIGSSLPHFRAGERTFQLLMQLTGRSGRAKPGEVIIQTFRPDSPEVLFASKHDSEGYLNQELKLRSALKYPPVTQMIRLILREPDAKVKAESLKKRLSAFNEERNLKLMISASPTFFSGGKQWHILVRGNSPRALVEEVNLERAVVDVNPLETL